MYMGWEGDGGKGKGRGGEWKEGKRRARKKNS